MERIIRVARPDDMADIMAVMDAAKKIMRQSGNMYQWGEGYPSEAVITADMEKDGGYVRAFSSAELLSEKPRPSRRASMNSSTVKLKIGLLLLFIFRSFKFHGAKVLQ